MPIKDGGAAFPIAGNCGLEVRGTVKGMSLRDYFAGEAITGLLGIGHSNDIVAKLAYKIADAMITEREKGSEG